jgi:hypothetical protein
MAFPTQEPVTTEQIGQSITVSGDAVTVNIPNPVQPNSLTVINWIKFSGQSSGATPVFTLTVNGVIIARKTMVSATADVVFDISFPSGWPVWATAGVDLVGATSLAVVVAGTTAVSNATLTVGYAQVPSAAMRT